MVIKLTIMDTELCFDTLNRDKLTNKKYIEKWLTIPKLYDCFRNVRIKIYYKNIIQFGLDDEDFDSYLWSIRCCIGDMDVEYFDKLPINISENRKEIEIYLPISYSNGEICFNECKYFDVKVCVRAVERLYEIENIKCIVDYYNK